MMLVLASLLSASMVFAEDDSAQGKLERAIELYRAQDYESAQQLVGEVDARSLSASDQKRMQRYVELTTTAVDQYYQAGSNLEQGGAALSAGKYARARQLLEEVVESEFATPKMREQAQRDLSVLDDVEQRRARLVGAQDQAAQGARDHGERRADQLVRRGHTAVNRSEYDLAQDFYQQALLLVPGHPDAERGLRQVALHRRVEADPARAPRASAEGQQPRIRLIDRLSRRRQIAWQRAVAAYRQAEQDIHKFVSENHFSQAHQALQFARETVESARQWAEPLSRYEQLKAEHEALADMVQTREREYNDRRAIEIRTDLQRREEQRRSRIENDRQQQIDLLMEQVEQKTDDRDLNGAIQVLRQVMVLDPKSVEAEWKMDQLLDVASVRRQKRAIKEADRETRELLLQVQEATVPWSNDINYPDNWLEIIRSPSRQLPGEYPLDLDDEDFEESFRSRIPEISFNQAGFGQALQQIAEIGDINIVPNWPDLALAGVTKDSPITLPKLRNIPVRTVLAEVIEQASGASSSPLDYAVRSSGIVKVATEDFLNREVFMRVYSVKDLIHPIPNYTDAPDFDLNSVRRKRHLAERRRSLFASHPVDHGEWRESVEPDLQGEQLAELVDIIRQHVLPGSGRSSGGAHATIHARADGNLVVTQTAVAHREIFNLLNQLREDDAVQIAIEARFLTVNSNFLEDMGIDLNIVLNNGNAGFDQGFSGGNTAFDPATGSRLLLPRNFSRLGFGPAAAPGGVGLGGGIPPDQPFGNPAFVPQNRSGGNGNFFTPIPVTTNLRSFTDPSTLASDVPGSFAGNTLAPALQIAGSFLDNIQVDFLIRATQADARTSTLIAPRLIMTNGQQSWIAITEEQNFVSELDPVVATGAAAQRPIVDTLNTGAVLNVQATVSPDRRYVTMNLQPGVGRLVAVNTFQFSGGPISGVGAPGFLQLPIIQRQQVKTTVTVPDGGTPLIGGQKVTFESEREA
ncbi:MAG: hypothetical protein IID41_11730, partial [Planctomycetes bacterium]|nr:hypothetical protein [Planctomycetota bacterium]